MAWTKAKTAVAAAVVVLLVGTTTIAVREVLDHRLPRVALGPMLSDVLLPDPLTRQTAFQMRSWVKTLKGPDVETLNRTGKIIFSWDAMVASYPEQARIIDNYDEQRRLGFVEVFKRQEKPIPEQLVQHQVPDTVEIKKKPSGECWVVISSTNGMAHSYLEVAAPAR